MPKIIDKKTKNCWNFLKINFTKKFSYEFLLASLNHTFQNIWKIEELLEIF